MHPRGRGTLYGAVAGALLINYANPMAMNCWLLDRIGIRHVGLCHSVQGTAEMLARWIGAPMDEITRIPVGGEQAYDVVVGRGLTDQVSALLPGADRVAGQARFAPHLHQAAAHRLQVVLLEAGRRHGEADAGVVWSTDIGRSQRRAERAPWHWPVADASGRRSCGWG